MNVPGDNGVLQRESSGACRGAPGVEVGQADNPQIREFGRRL